MLSVKISDAFTWLVLNSVGYNGILMSTTNMQTSTLPYIELSMQRLAPSNNFIVAAHVPDCAIAVK